MAHAIANLPAQRWYDKSNFLAVPIHTQVTHNPSIYLFLRDVAWQMTLTCGTTVLSAFNTKPSSDNSATKLSDSFFTSKADRGKKGCHPQIEKRWEAASHMTNQRQGHQLSPSISAWQSVTRCNKTGSKHIPVARRQ